MLEVAAAGLLWVAVEIGFALHGWSAASRYLIEPAAVCIVIAAALVGQLLGQSAVVPRARRARWLVDAIAWGGPVLVVVLGVSLIGSARLRVHDWRVDLPLAHANGRQNRRLIAVVQRIGGGAAVRACGKPATIPGTQSTLAWAVGLNVGDVSNHIGRAIRQRQRGHRVLAARPRLARARLQPAAGAGGPLRAVVCRHGRGLTARGIAVQGSRRRSPNRAVLLAARGPRLVEPRASAMDDHARMYRCNMAAGDSWSWSYHAPVYAWRFI